ncbi:MAG: UDP-glucose 4-epimerase GalE [Clostridiales Family XIII bacterium]|jgi:UDP-glucose 4-epimerase|nr:UDP-glucose 4-epimerase GalE [Clostridiales Family XIII bacterium]
MSVLICGGAGYIGSHCARELKKEGFDCLIFDNLSEGHRAAVGDLPLIVGDLLDESALESVFASHEIDAVLHFAAFALVGESVKRPLEYYRNNVVGTINLLRAMQKRGVKRIVFSSTCAVYGEPARMPIAEDAPAAPVNPYGETKLAVERMLAACDAAHGIKSVCLRYFNAAGAAPDGDIGEDHALETHLIPLIFKVALGLGEKLTVYGNDHPTKDGGCVRDYIHVLDLADAHARALRHLLDGGESRAYNLGTGKGASVFEVIETASRVSGRDIPYEIAARRAGDPAVLIASADKIRRELGWKPQRGELETILADAWRWHHTHPSGYGDGGDAGNGGKKP